MRNVLVALVIAIAAFTIYGIVADSSPAVYYIPITIVLIGAVGLLHKTAQFSDSTLWALAGAAIGNLAGGIILVNGSPLYELALVGEIRYDKVFHAVATGIAAWASFEAILRWSSRRRRALIFVAIMMASGTGALVEIVEYIGTLLRENTVVGDYTNNMQDLIANTIGALAGAFAAYRWQPAPNPEGAGNGRRRSA